MTVLILAATVVAYPFAERLLNSKSPAPSAKPTPSIVSELKVPPRPTNGATSRPASRSATRNERRDASKPAEGVFNEREAAVVDGRQPATESMRSTTTDGKAQQLTSNQLSQTSSIPAPTPNLKSDSDSGTASTSVPAPNPNAIVPRDTTSNLEPATINVIDPPHSMIRLVIRERRAPAGANCAAVHFERVSATMTEVPRVRSDHFAPSLHEGLCGLEFAIINSGSPAYVAAFTTMASGQFLDTGRAPEALGGGSPFKGEKSWAVNIARRLRGPIDYRLVAVISGRPALKITKQLRANADAGVAAKDVLEGITILHAGHRIDPLMRIDSQSD